MRAALVGVVLASAVVVAQPTKAASGGGGPQVSGGTCGVGKVCTVRALKINGNGGTSTFEPNANGVSFSINGVNYGTLGYAGVYSLFATANVYVYASLTAGTTITSGTGFLAPVAYASLPTCNGSSVGRLLYDSTNSVWRYCDGSEWRMVASAASTATKNPTLWMTGAGDMSTSEGGPYALGSAKVLTAHDMHGISVTFDRDPVFSLTAGTGSGYWYVNVVDEDGVTNLKSAAFPCNTTLWDYLASYDSDFDNTLTIAAGTKVRLIVTGATTNCSTVPDGRITVNTY